MPSLAAALIATVAGWIVDSLVAPIFGIEMRIFIGLVVTPFAYVYSRNWLLRLRDG